MKGTVSPRESIARADASDACRGAHLHGSREKHGCGTEGRHAAPWPLVRTRRRTRLAVGAGGLGAGADVLAGRYARVPAAPRPGGAGRAALEGTAGRRAG